MELLKFTKLLILTCFGISLSFAGSAEPCNLAQYDFADMQTDMGIWQDGGSDCDRITNPDGSWSIRLRDNSTSSYTVTSALDFSGVSSVEINFSYIPESMENGEDFFLEYSTDGGTSFTIARSWASNAEFLNNQRNNDSVLIEAQFTANTLFRFRCDASSNYDRIYLDNIGISRCGVSNPPTFDCPDLAANIGDACDDGNASTENDVVLNNCSCAGTPVPPAFDCPDLAANIGDACDDGNASTENDVVLNNCSCAGTPVPPTFDCPDLAANIGDACDDGNASTENDVVQNDCSCAGTPIPPTFDCPDLSSNFGDLCDDGDASTENDVVQNDCSCAGTPIPPNFDCPDLSSNFGDLCDDGDASTENDVVQNDCSCAGTPIPPTLDCPDLAANIGDACDDGNASTENDMVLNDCSCAGTPIPPSNCEDYGDADNDGVCDIEDCQPYNPAFPTTPGTPCDDGNSRTTNDVIIEDGCGCAGQINTEVCNYILENHHDWESGYGFWKDGGRQSSILSGTTSGIPWSVLELEDNDGILSSTYTDPLDFSTVEKVQIDFLVRFRSMEYGEDLYLEYSTNGGTHFQTVRRWISGQNFYNSSNFSQEVVEITGNFSTQTVFRLRCDASSSFDKVYIDDIKISTCSRYSDPHAGKRPTYRTLDGKLNNFENPEYGTVGSPLFREIPAQYGDGVSSLAGPNRPNPRHISNQLSDEPQDRRDERLLSGMAYQFGQFLDHDIVITEGGNEFAPIGVPGYDPVFAGNGIIPFTRSGADFSTGTREQFNNITSYIDASNVYGVDPVRASWLRTFKDGKLKTSKGNLLPYNTIDGEWESPIDLSAPRMELDRERNGTPRKLAVAGDFRANEHPNLTAFHTLFVREHNRLCDILKKQGERDDEIIYQKARKLVGAMMQRIVYDEFVPAFGVSLNRYNGYNANARADIRNTFATAAYRWHTMVENDIILRNDACEGIAGVELPLKTIFSNPEILRAYGPGVLLRGLAFHPQYRTDLKINNGLRNFLLGQGSGLDLASINIQRGRDHGLPDYKTTRLYYGGSHISSFSDINSDSEISNRMARVYNNVNDVDLWVGMFSEPLAPGTSLPPTAIAIIKKQFEELRDGDFYYYKNDPFLTNSDLNIVQSSGLADIIERNTSARSMPDDIFFKPPCSDDDPLEDLNDHGEEVCTEIGATFINSCLNSSGTAKSLGYHYNNYDLRQIKVNLGYAVRIYNQSGESAYYTDDTGCLPNAFSGSNISAVEVICLSNDASTIDCSSFAGALYEGCFTSALPITTTGSFNTEQLKSLGAGDNEISALRVHNGFKVTLYSGDNFEGDAEVYYGPTVLCLPWSMRNRVSSMEVVCLSDPDRSNCGTNGIGGAVFPHSSGDSENPGPKDHIGTTLGPGDYNLARMRAMGLYDNDIEKVNVNNGYSITLFENDYFGGAYRTFLGDESSLSDFYNRASSIKVQCIESLSQYPVAAKSSIDLNAKKKDDTAELTLSHSLTKEAGSIGIEKYDGKLGDFEAIEDIVVDQLSNTYTIIDPKLQEGDNVYRATVFYVDGTQEETEIQIVRFNANKLYNIFPNPASNVLNVDMKEYLGTNVQISIYNLLGSEISSQQYDNLQQSQITFDLTNTNAGTYLIKVDSEGRRAISKKFTVIKP